MTTKPANQAPWQRPQPSYGLKVLITFAVIILLIIALVSLILLFAIVTGGTRSAEAPASANSELLFAAVTFVLLVASSACLVLLFPLVQAPTNFKPSYSPVAPDIGGHPFDIRYRQAGWGRRMSGKGTARFDTDALVIEGWLTPHPLLQIAVVLVVTILPIVLFGFGLGLIPALIIAYFLGRKKITRSIPYSGIRDLTMKGCLATFSIPEGPPSKISFASAQVDGERLYREMQFHAPAVLTVL